MCVFSAVSPTYTRPDSWPWRDTLPEIPPLRPQEKDFDKILRPLVDSTEARSKKLEERVAVLEKLLQAAKKFDTDTGQPDCELDEKVQLLKQLAEKFGGKIEFPK